MTISAYLITPMAGVDLDAKGSSLLFGLGMAVLASDGFKYMYVRADTALGSTTNCLVSSGAAFSADTAASALLCNYTCRTTGGVVAGQYFWAREKKFGALT